MQDLAVGRYAGRYGEPSDQTDPAGDPAEFRAADSDRDRVAEVLRQAAGDGRLTLDELDERLNRVFAARTYAELAPITRDLPQSGQPLSVPAVSRRTSGKPTSHFAIAIMSGFTRAGHWIAGRNFTAFALMGGGQLDLRDASFAEGLQGVGIMGGIDHPRTRPSQPGAPRIYVFGLP